MAWNPNDPYGYNTQGSAGDPTGVNGRLIDQVYQSSLGRAADAEGRNYWLNSGLTGNALVDAMVSAGNAERDVTGYQYTPKAGYLGTANLMDIYLSERRANNPTYAYTQPWSPAPTGGGSAYDPSRNAAARGASHMAGGVQLVPGAPGWIEGGAAAAPYYAQMGYSQNPDGSFNWAAGNYGYGDNKKDFGAGLADDFYNKDSAGATTGIGSGNTYRTQRGHNRNMGVF